ncbi:MAG: hypothetical protein LBO69_04305 [Ignavibacteria bacterium]|jgi:uncharacterized membrane protein YagU involved in acid resistance|nr:hypothetical protein [Ignavibacteria bacterium]
MTTKKQIIFSAIYAIIYGVFMSVVLSIISPDIAIKDSILFGIILVVFSFLVRTITIYVQTRRDRKKSELLQ